MLLTVSTRVQFQIRPKSGIRWTGAGSDHTLSASMNRPSVSATLIASWGIFGVLALCSRAVWNLTPIALEPWRNGGMDSGHVALYMAWVIFNAYAEGWRGFHRAFSPRTVGRAFQLGKSPGPVRVLLAPAIAMGLFQATRKRMLVSWSLLGAIVMVIILIRMLPQPWRGIIDGGVVVGLVLGMISLLYFHVRAIGGIFPPMPLDFPEGEPDVRSQA